MSRPAIFQKHAQQNPLKGEKITAREATISQTLSGFHSPNARILYFSLSYVSKLKIITFLAGGRTKQEHFKFNFLDKTIKKIISGLSND